MKSKNNLPGCKTENVASLIHVFNHSTNFTQAKEAKLLVSRLQKICSFHHYWICIRIAKTLIRYHEVCTIYCDIFFSCQIWRYFNISKILPILTDYVYLIPKTTLLSNVDVYIFGYFVCVYFFQFRFGRWRGTLHA